MKISRPSKGITRIKIPLASRSEASLSAALDELLEATRSMRKLMRGGERLVTTFSTPGHHFLRERRFFELCAAFPALHPKMLRYVAQVGDAKARVWHTDVHPAGSFAIVPLALQSREYLAPLVAHLRHVDLDHETFHLALVKHLVDTHGLGEETLDLLAFRAVDGAGANGLYNLRSAADAHGLPLEAFAARVKKVSKRSAHLGLYVSNAGKRLAKNADEYAAWLGTFRKVTFSESERRFEPDARRYEKPWPPKDWSDDDPEDALVD